MWETPTTQHHVSASHVSTTNTTHMPLPRYLYLLFDDEHRSPDHWMQRGNYIFTTEAHVFPIAPHVLEQAARPGVGAGGLGARRAGVDGVGGNGEVGGFGEVEGGGGAAGEGGKGGCRPEVAGTCGGDGRIAMAR